MRRSSQINQANLFAILMGEKRRKPLVRRALVSFLYPIFIEPESVEPVFSFMAGSRLWVPPTFIHQVSPAFSFLAGGTLDDYDPFINYGPEVEQVSPALSFRAGGTLNDYDPFVNYTHPVEDGASPLLGFRSGGFMYDAAIRHTVSPEDKVSPALSFRAGGTLTG